MSSRTSFTPLATLAILLAAALLGFGAAAGCGGEDEGEPEAPSEPAQTLPEGSGPGAGEGTEGPGGGPAGEEPDPAPTRRQVEATIERFVTSTDPAVVCEALSTPELVERSFGDRAGCRQALEPEAVADSVTVRRIRIDEAGASAVAVPRGGVNDGLEVEVELVRRDGALLVDRFEADVPVGP